MGQDFVGSNNIPLLEPIGQFGSRIMGGSDSAQPRYIHTKLPDIIPHIYNKEDFNVLEYIDDDGHLVEPEFYAPIIPMLLVNGSEGIGTGWSTYIPSYNPLDIIDNLKLLLNSKNVDEEELIEMKPWYRGFTGKIEKMTDTSYVSYGSYTKVNSSQVEITELPIRSWTDKYKEFLESMIIDNSKDKKSKQYLRNYTSQCTDNKVHFTLTFASDVLEDIISDTNRNAEGQNKFEKLFKLTSKINTGNMVLYNEEGYLKKYKNVSDILKNYFKVRLNLYHKRKNYQLEALKKELVIVNAKVRFIMEFIEEKIIISNRSKKNLIEQLVNGKYPTVNGDEEFGYLIKMPIYNLTKERIEELKKDRDVKTEMFNNLEKTSETKLWSGELDSLKKEYLKFLEMKKSNDEDVGQKKKKIIKKKK